MGNIVNLDCSKYLTIFWDLVFCLQITQNLATVKVGGTTTCEFNSSGSLGLAVQLQKTEVVAFTEDIAGRLSKVGIHWWGHCELLDLNIV